MLGWKWGKRPKVGGHGVVKFRGAIRPWVALLFVDQEEDCPSPALPAAKRGREQDKSIKQVLPQSVGL